MHLYLQQVSGYLVLSAGSSILLLLFVWLEWIMQGMMYTITDVKELHDWMVEHITRHPLFEIVPQHEVVSGCAFLMYNKWLVLFSSLGSYMFSSSHSWSLANVLQRRLNRTFLFWVILFLLKFWLIAICNFHVKLKMW